MGLAHHCRQSTLSCHYRGIFESRGVGGCCCTQSPGAASTASRKHKLPQVADCQSRVLHNYHCACLSICLQSSFAACRQEGQWCCCMGPVSTVLWIGVFLMFCLAADSGIYVATLHAYCHCHRHHGPLWVVQVPSAKDIQSKLDKPLAKLELPPALANKPKELANAAKVNTPNADNLASKVLPAPPPPPQQTLPSSPSSSSPLCSCLVYAPASFLVLSGLFTPCCSNC